MKYTIEEDPPTISMLCRKYGYERTINDRVYCTKPEEKCIYMEDERDDYGYRCMMLEKQI